MTLLMRVNRHCFGVAARDVERVLPAAGITPLPEAPAAIAGLVNIHGDLTPVFDLRRRLDGEASPASLSARLIVLRRTGRRLALLADQADELQAIPEEAIAAVEALVPGAGWL